MQLKEKYVFFKGCSMFNGKFLIEKIHNFIFIGRNVKNKIVSLKRISFNV